MSRQEIKDRLVVLLGGRVAEEITVGEISTGAQDDLLERHRPGAPHGARAGDERVDGPRRASSRGAAAPRASAGPPAARHDYSDETARAVDAEVARLLGEAQARARALLPEHRDALERVARRLLEAETMTGEELRALAGVRLDSQPT